jgi:hypothetical protein
VEAEGLLRNGREAFRGREKELKKTSYGEIVALKFDATIGQVTPLWYKNG